ncbi:hypothetical protein M426DRAFT_10358 [Hypoxylon sp. CI-4A]|nr:hypothetical protein M426DRAFT_10358 [Hypoxylon sp. CI-4A]
MPGRYGNGYEWYEMGFFAQWSEDNIIRVLCIDIPPPIRHGLQNTLAMAGSSPAELGDPFAMLYPLLDEVVTECDDNVWRVTKEARHENATFEALNNLSRHVRHLVEVQSVAIETWQALISQQRVNFSRLSDKVSERHKIQAIEHLEFQSQMMKGIRWRAQASSDRLDGEIQLAYNILASTDSQIMKSIALLTMLFLPATFVATLFSTTFFSFDEDGWLFSKAFWIYWAVVIPLTIVVLLAWWLWLGGSTQSIRLRLLHTS